MKENVGYRLTVAVVLVAVLVVFLLWPRRVSVAIKDRPRPYSETGVDVLTLKQGKMPSGTAVHLDGYVWISAKAPGYRLYAFAVPLQDPPRYEAVKQRAKEALVVDFSLPPWERGSLPRQGEKVALCGIWRGDHLELTNLAY